MSLNIQYPLAGEAPGAFGIRHPFHSHPEPPQTSRDLHQRSPTLDSRGATVSTSDSMCLRSSPENRVASVNRLVSAGDYFLRSSYRTCFAEAFRVSKTPMPWVATASKVGSPLVLSARYMVSTATAVGRSRLLN